MRPAFAGLSAGVFAAVPVAFVSHPVAGVRCDDRRSAGGNFFGARFDLTRCQRRLSAAAVPSDTTATATIRAERYCGGIPRLNRPGLCASARRANHRMHRCLKSNSSTFLTRVAASKENLP